MPRKRTTLVLSACLSSIRLGGYAAIGCGYPADPQTVIVSVQPR
jgi:hypothetical protein